MPRNAELLTEIPSSRQFRMQVKLSIVPCRNSNLAMRVFISKKILTNVTALSDNIRFKTIKVSTKGQITLPSDIQKEIGLKKGDDILLIKKGRRILIEKVDGMAKKMRDEFKDLEEFSEDSLKRLWLNKSDEIWNQYLKR